MNPKDAWLYEQICLLAQGIEDKEKAIVGLLYLAVGLGCKDTQEKNGNKPPYCKGCIFSSWGLCHEIHQFCQYHGVSNKYEEEVNEKEASSQ